ncbi:hypothetical protein ACWFNS_04505 [Oerskovia enterophila]
MTRTSAPGAPHGASPGTPPNETAPRAAVRTVVRAQSVRASSAEASVRRFSALTSLVVAGFLLVVGTLSLLADRGFSVVHQCLPAPGGWGVAGIHLALLRETAECPAGTAALGGDPARVVTVVGVLALPVLLAHLVLLLAGCGLAAVALRVRDRLVGVLRPRSLPALLHRPLAPVADACRQVVRSATKVLHHLALAAVRSLRGPPTALAAA